MQPNSPSLAALLQRIRGCAACASHLAAGVRPIVQAGRTAPILIIGQAPGSKVHASGVPWQDPSGDRLRAWTGLSPDTFYDEARVALVPMGFCYPGRGPSGDLPPRPECAPLWHAELLSHLPQDRLTLLVGSHAQKAYAGPLRHLPMTDIVRRWRDLAPAVFPLPHPSWRSVSWMRRNPWFETDVLPELAAQVARRIGAS